MRLESCDGVWSAWFGLHRQFRIVAESLCGMGNVERGRLLHGLPDIQRLNSRQSLRVSIDQIRQPAENGGALLGGHGSPTRSGERLPGGYHRKIHILRSAIGNPREKTARARVEHLDATASSGIPPPAADE